MRRFLCFGASVSAILVLSATAASGGPPGTFSLQEHGRAIASDDASIDVAAGDHVAVATATVAPGSEGLLAAEVADTLVLVTGGAVMAQRACGAERERWEAGKAYYQGAAPILVSNQGREAAHLVAVFLNLRHGRSRTTGSMPCPGITPLPATQQGHGIAHSNGTVEVQAGKKTIVQHFVIEPGFNFFWHKHPPSIIIQIRGTTTEYSNCTDTMVWEPGYAYHHTPGHHDHGPMTAKNEGQEAAELLAVFFNAPEWHPAPLVPRDVQPPYLDCPTRSLL